MNKPKFVFSQLVAFMDSDKFRHIVDKYGGNRYVKLHMLEPTPYTDVWSVEQS